MVVLPVSECTSCLRLRMCVHFEVARAEGQGEVLTVNIATQGIGGFGLVGARSQIGLYITSSVAPCECNFSCFFRSFVSSIFLSLYTSTLLFLLGVPFWGRLRESFYGKVFRQFGNPGSVASKIWCHCSLRRHCLWGRGIHL